MQAVIVGDVSEVKHDAGAVVIDDLASLERHQLVDFLLPSNHCSINLLAFRSSFNGILVCFGKDRVRVSLLSRAHETQGVGNVTVLKHVQIEHLCKLFFVFLS